MRLLLCALVLIFVKVVSSEDGSLLKYDQKGASSKPDSIPKVLDGIGKETQNRLTEKEEKFKAYLNGLGEDDEDVKDINEKEEEAFFDMVDKLSETEPVEEEWGDEEGRERNDREEWEDGDEEDDREEEDSDMSRVGEKGNEIVDLTEKTENGTVYDGMKISGQVKENGEMGETAAKTDDEEHTYHEDIDEGGVDELARVGENGNEIIDMTENNKRSRNGPEGREEGREEGRTKEKTKENTEREMEGETEQLGDKKGQMVFVGAGENGRPGVEVASQGIDSSTILYLVGIIVLIIMAVSLVGICVHICSSKRDERMRDHDEQSSVQSETSNETSGAEPSEYSPQSIV